ncbi:hypothetical protein DO97_06520 [Neosynechococcus sphagnicola sy1]|uniref:Uncharacterized protein n=2 Tax=Neosynechococcus TaxID=1501143 RepID=A0A098TK49_9CYAN|nr:hypothetical protein DO97_06520 [Neosynechococcus sphagnicola sy1]
MAEIAGNYFPPEYKQFPFKEGDLLARCRSDGKFAITKILKIDRVFIKKGEAINIQGKSFIAPVDDYLLIVSASYGESEFDSLEQARTAALSGEWHIRFGHVPNRPPGAAAGQRQIGSEPVIEAELEGFHTWKQAFDKGEAGVF